MKNEDHILPLKRSETIALIGPTAGQVASIGAFGERSPGVPERQVGPLAAMKRLAPTANISFAVADDMTGTTITAAMFTHDGRPGLLRTDAAGQTSSAANIDFTRTNGKALPANTAAIWKGELMVPSDGAYWLYLQALGTRATIAIDGKELGRTGAVKGTVHGDIQHATQDNGIPTTDGLDNVRRAVQLTKGPHAIEVATSADTSNAPVQLRLNWMTPEARAQAHAAAIDAAKHSKTAVVFAWTRDKPHFQLPGEQDALIEEIAAVNPNTIVVLNTSQPVKMPWIDKVKGVIEMWWPGDEGGVAEAKLLLGLSNPGGKLPMTWAKSLEDYPATSPAHPERSAAGVDGKTNFSEGVLVGYRWFDDQKIEPLYPFGFGLSYTNFTMSGLKATPNPEGGALVSLHVKNIGSVAGDTVPQVYMRAPESKADGAQFAPKTLVAFDRITLGAGEERDVTLKIAPRAFQYWSTGMKMWVKPAGKRTILAGDSSRSLPLTTEVK